MILLAAGCNSQQTPVSQPDLGQLSRQQIQVSQKVEGEFSDKLFNFYADENKTALDLLETNYKVDVKNYPGITARWEKEDSNYEAGFKKDDKQISVLYQANGTMQESEVSIKESELPPSVLNYVKENYKGKKIKESAKITKADGTLNYEVEVDGKDLIFDINGKFLKVAKD